MSQFPALDSAFDGAEASGAPLEELEAIDQALASGSLSVEAAIEKLEAMHGPNEGACEGEQPLPDEPSAEQQGSSDLFSDQMRLLPFLVNAGADDGPDEQEYIHTLPSGTCVNIAEFPNGVGQAAQSGMPAWCWRVWDSAKLVADELAQRDLSKCGVIELGAGAGLASIAAAKLGAAVVCATDLPRALPLARYNLERNGAQLVDGDGPATKGDEPGAVLCPGRHVLVGAQADHEDYVCNVCGLEDEMLGGGIPEGETVYCCRECDFDICDGCHRSAASAEWAVLPGWFRLQCAPEVHRASCWQLPSESVMVLHPWDLLEGTEGAMELAAARVIECSRQAAANEPEEWLVVAADVSCHEALIQPLVSALRTLGDVLPGKASAILVHEKREAAVDEALLVALDEAGLAYERRTENTPEQLQQMYMTLKE